MHGPPARVRLGGVAPVEPEDPARLARELADAIASGLAPTEVTGLVQRVDALLAAHQGLVLAVCRRSVADRERALELAQETLLRAWQKLATFRGESSFRSWLIGIARYECVNAIRKRGDHLTEDGVIEATDPGASALSGLRRQEREALVRDAAAAVLDPLEQEVVQLRYVELLPLERIEALLALDGASGARGVLQRCRRKLGRELGRRLAELGHGSSLLRDSS